MIRANKPKATTNLGKKEIFAKNQLEKWKFCVFLHWKKRKFLEDSNIMCSFAKRNKSNIINYDNNDN